MSGAEHTPVTKGEAEFLHDLGWSSGFGWENGLDWFHEPSAGPCIWITDDPSWLEKWLDDRKQYAAALRRKRAKDHATELLEAVENLLPIADGSEPCVGSAYELALDLARNVLRKINNGDAS